ncbi:MAG: hypothetical protein IT210_06005 [Armatimonadetes bacterium]|nr:hypothetical protein [Armatimonadota bacterium]
MALTLKCPVCGGHRLEPGAVTAIRRDQSIYQRPRIVFILDDTHEHDLQASCCTDCGHIELYSKRLRDKALYNEVTENS